MALLSQHEIRGHKKDKHDPGISLISMIQIDSLQPLPVNLSHWLWMGCIAERSRSLALSFL
jgi:hypothetical protein